MVEFRRTHGAQEHGIAGQASVQGALRQGRALRADGRAANQLLFEAKFNVIEVAQRAQHAHCFRAHLRANAVAGENRDLESHRIGPNFCTPATPALRKDLVIG